MHQPFDVFCFVFVSHKKHHAIILKIQNPSFEIQRDPSHVTFFNIGHEVRSEIDNIKCPSVYRLTQIQNIFSMCISWHGYVWKEIIFIGLAHPFLAKFPHSPIHHYTSIYGALLFSVSPVRCACIIKYGAVRKFFPIFYRIVLSRRGNLFFFKLIFLYSKWI